MVASLLVVKRNFWLQPTRWIDLRFWYLRCNLALSLYIHCNMLGGNQNQTLINLQPTLNATLDHFFHIIDIDHVSHTLAPPKVVNRVYATWLAKYHNSINNNKVGSFMCCYSFFFLCYLLVLHCSLICLLTWDIILVILTFLSSYWTLLIFLVTHLLKMRIL